MPPKSTDPAAELAALREYATHVALALARRGIGGGERQPTREAGAHTQATLTQGAIMAAWDKLELMDQLLALGWREATDEEKASTGLGNSQYVLVPPESLWLNKPRAFHVYDAQEIQDLLSPQEP